MTVALESRPIAEDPDRTWKVKGTVAKYDASDMHRRIRRDCVRRVLRRTSPFDLVPKKGVKPYEVVNFQHNLLLNAGIQRLEDLLIGAGGTAFNAANSRIGTGDTNTAAAATQTDLQAIAGATHRQFKLVSSGPTRATNTITWVATFASGEGNFAWAEWGIDNGTADGTTVTAPMLNRKVASLGTKVSGAVWVFTVTLTVS